MFNTDHAYLLKLFTGIYMGIFEFFMVFYSIFRLFLIQVCPYFTNPHFLKNLDAHL